MTLPCLVGSIGKPGGGMITWERPASPQPELSPFENPYPTTIPAFQWWRTLEQPQTLTKERGLKGAEQLDGPVRYIFSIASGMMVNQHSDIHNTLRILQQTDSVRTIVLTDLFMTPSARNADLLLPAPSFLKRTISVRLGRVRIICCTIMRRFPRFLKQSWSWIG